MKGFFQLLPLLLALFSMRPAFAYDQGKPDDIEFAIVDNPVEVAHRLMKELPTLDRDQRFSEWIRALTAVLRAEAYVEYPGDPNDLAYAEREAKARGFYREYLYIKRFRLNRQVDINTMGIEDCKQAYADLIAEAQQLKQKGIEYRLIADLAWTLMDSGNIKGSVTKLMEIPKTNPPDSGIGFYEWMELLQDIVASMPTDSILDRQLSMYKEIIAELEDTRPRYLLALIKANAAVNIMNKQAESPEMDIEALLYDAIRMATEIDSRILLGSSMSSLGRFYHTKGKFQDAIKQYNKALAIFKTVDQPLWMADTQKKLAMTLVSTKQFREAEVLVEKARRFFNKDYKNDHLQILYLLHQIQANRQNYKEAFAILQEYLKFYRDKLAANEQTEISSRLIGIEINVEQARSQALEMEVAAKQRKARVEEQLQEVTEQRHKMLGLFIRGVLLLLVVIAVLFICAHTLHKKTEAVNQHIRENILLRFVPPALAYAIATGERRIDQETQRFDITVVFARIAHFDELIEKLGPNYLTEALSPFLEAMSEVIFAHGGTIDKFNRGTLMLIFGAPVPMTDEDQVRSATRCAEAMILRLDEMQEKWSLPHGLRLQLSIGIHHGPALVGFFGGEQRTDYTAIGATVNVASRIEGLVAPGDIVVSEVIALKLRNEEYRLLGHFQLKGIEADQALYSWIRQGEQEAVS